MNSDNFFWNFSLEHYAKTPVQALCLQLQKDAGANVNVVLFSLWLASCGRIFENDVLANNTDLSHWHEQVVLPLRQARCAVKQCRPNDGLYEVLKKSELDAERVEQDILCALLPQFAEVSDELPLQQLAQWSIRVYLQVLPLPDELVVQYSEKLVGDVFLIE